MQLCAGGQPLDRHRPCHPDGYERPCLTTHYWYATCVHVQEVFVGLSTRALGSGSSSGLPKCFVANTPVSSPTWRQSSNCCFQAATIFTSHIEQKVQEDEVPLLQMVVIPLRNSSWLQNLSDLQTQVSVAKAIYTDAGTVHETPSRYIGRHGFADGVSRQKNNIKQA